MIVVFLATPLALLRSAASAHTASLTALASLTSHAALSALTLHRAPHSASPNCASPPLCAALNARVVSALALPFSTTFALDLAASLHDFLGALQVLLGETTFLESLKRTLASSTSAAADTLLRRMLLLHLFFARTSFSLSLLSEANGSDGERGERETECFG